MKKKNTKQQPTSAKRIPIDKTSLPVPIDWKEVLKSKWLLPLIFLSILIILFSFRTIYNYDVGFHLRGGQWITENLSVPDNDVYTYTVNHNKYIDMHWLYQVLVFGIYSVFSYTGVTIMNTLFILVIFYLMLRRMMFYGVPTGLSILLLLLTLITIQIRFHFRPEILTWVGILLVLLLLDKYFYSKKRVLFLLPIIMVFWVNIQGLFILGLFLIGAYFLSIWIHEKRLDKYFLKWAVISFLVTFINPYFEKIVFQPFVLFTRLGSDNIFKSTISEFNSPFSFTGNLGNFDLELYLYFVICLLSLALLLVTIRKRKLHEFIILAAFFYLSYSQFRNIPIFVIYAVNIIAVSLLGIFEESNKLEKLFVRFGNFLKLVPYVTIVVLILLALRVYNNSYFVSYDMGIDFGIGLNDKILPVKSSEFLLENELDGKLINQLGFGSWFVWKLPQPVFIDGRLEVMKEDFYSEYRNGFKQGGLKSLIDKYEPQLIVFNYAVANNWTSQLSTLPDWRAIYWDENSVVFARNDYAVDIPEIDFYEVLVKNRIDTNITEQKVTDIFFTKPKTQFSNWLGGFYEKRENYTGLMNMALYAIENKKLKVAEIIYLHIIKNADGRLNKYLISLYQNLGSIYFLRKEFNKSLYCYHIYLKHYPGDDELMKKVNFLRSKTGVSY